MEAEDFIVALMERIHPPLARRITVGTEVKTDRGYGTVAGIVPQRALGRARREQYALVIEFEDGQRACRNADEVQVVERA